MSFGGEQSDSPNFGLNVAKANTDFIDFAQHSFQTKRRASLAITQISFKHD